jgi:O-methyltransferase
MHLATRIARRFRGAPPSKPIPVDLEPEREFLEIAKRCQPYTMTSWERQFALYTAVQHVHRHRIDGAFVECGVWRGGSSMLAALTFDALGDRERSFYLYDTFAGMTEPTPEDGAVARERWDERRTDADHHPWAYASRDEVEANLGGAGIDMGRVRLVEGPVEETIPGVLPDRIALLRLDTDWYESTKHELVHMYDLVPPGGIVLLDDYGHWEGARQAVDEFLAERGIEPLLMRIDRAGRLFVKPDAGT